MSKLSQTLFTLSIILIITSCYADSSNTTSPSSSLCPISLCGNIFIRYPFWIKSQTINTRDQFCGYPDFGLECSKSNKTIINLPSDTYYVTDINYDNSSITLVDIDILDQKCPRVRKNVTLSNLPLSFSKLDLNLSFYFNCSSYPPYLDPIGCFRVSNDEKLRSYVFVDGDEGEIGYDNWKCEDHVVVSVKVDEGLRIVLSVRTLVDIVDMVKRVRTLHAYVEMVVLLLRVAKKVHFFAFNLFSCSIRIVLAQFFYHYMLA
ncbi:hypothetical protein KIW84_UN0591 [Lathyrus oleraceus]|nr:hypothetical protein KIW84_UN0591 [Pisum sativum]